MKANFKFIVIPFLIILTVANYAVAVESTQAPLKIYMMPNGNDNNDGSSLDAAILTLTRAQSILKNNFPNQDRSIEILIGSGTYYKQEAYWSLTMPNHTITFQPYSLAEPVPVFDGKGLSGMFRLLGHSDGKKTNLIFRNLKFKNYGTVINFRGDPEKARSSSSFNIIERCYFENTGKGSTAVIGIINSRNNKITNNYFKDVLVGKPNNYLLHAIYLAHNSSNNTINNNFFANCDGDPIRIRNNSNSNIISNNTFDHCGYKSTTSEWFCNKDTMSYCARTECPSYNNLVYKNTMTIKGGPGSTVTYRPISINNVLKITTVTGCESPDNTLRIINQKNIMKEKVKNSPDVITHLILYMTL